MRPHEPNNVNNPKPPTRHRGYSPFYFQQEGQCSHLRFTLLGATMVTLIVVIPVIALFILFSINSQAPEPQINTNITVQPTVPYSANTTIIRQAPAPPKNIKQPKYSMPAPPTIQMPSNNANEPIDPKQTPQLSPSESPP